jgi:hypothetical protein
MDPCSAAYAIGSSSVAYSALVTSSEGIYTKKILSLHFVSFALKSLERKPNHKPHEEDVPFAMKMASQQ